MLKKSTLREIRSSLGRYLAILAIVMLGVGFFCGLKSTKPAMVTTANEYLKKNKMYDYQLQSTLGLTEKDVDAVARQNEVEAAEGSVTEDSFITKGKHPIRCSASIPSPQRSMPST